MILKPSAFHTLKQQYRFLRIKSWLGRRPFHSKRILCCIFNYNENEKAIAWSRRLSPYFDTVILDSGSQPPCDDPTAVHLDNIYYSGLMNEAYEESVMIDKVHEYIFEDGGEIPASGDISLIKQAARILIENASKYTPEGGEIKLRSLVSDGHPAFSVQDSGIGISESDIPYIFDRFYRADDSRSKQTGGSGLGLAIAKWIIERHGGRFEVISRKDIGTRITVILP